MKMMENVWTLFCSESGCLETSGKSCGSTSTFELLSHPSSCTNHALVIFFDVVLLVMLLISVVNKSSSKHGQVPARFQGLSTLQIVSAILNGCLGLSFLFLGIWILEEKLKRTHTALPLSWWFQALFQGFTKLFVGLTVSVKVKQLPQTPVRLLSILATLFAGFACVLSLFAAVLNKQVTIEIALDVLSLPGAVLLLLCAYKSCKYEERDEDVVFQSSLYTPLNGEANGIDKGDHDSVTAFSKAGSFSKFSFWWLNSLMKKGRERALEDEDIPKLREADRAESCYLTFLEQLEKHKKKDPSSSQPSMLKIIIFCHWKEILISGFFALIKVLTLSAGPLILNAFILVAEGKQSFKYEGYVLAITLFLSKSLESISQRQWYFRSKLIGIQVRSLLTAAIYKKQLRLSNSARLIHSSGEIMNYVSVDAYRIGEFPFWFHQTWTITLQTCFALVILFRAVGLATVAALVAISFMVIFNAPLAKLQHKFLVKLMTAQDERLKALSEALVNMKVLKLYAWETHFKNVIESLRKVEVKWLSAVHFQKAYNCFLFWSSPLLVSASTFGACYFLNVPLHTNNVFTFIATLRLVQDPISSLPDVVGVVIQAKVAFARIIKFLEAPELQNENLKKYSDLGSVKKGISIISADFSWEENLSKPTLRNINLELSPGKKVAICGEVGSGKSTLLAAILGEVQNVRGNIQVYGKIAYVSQTAWIQTGTIQDNILFGSPMDGQRYRETIERCSLVKDLELLSYGDLTEIGERGVNLSGGQKQRIQLARALYQNADIYLLDDPFSAVDAHTATSLFNEYVMEALSEKIVLLVTHQVDFLPAFDSVLLMSDGEILQSAPYHHLLSISQEFHDLVNAHKETVGSEGLAHISPVVEHGTSGKVIKKIYMENFQEYRGDQLIKKEERETGDTRVKPYHQYLNQNKGYLYFFFSIISQLIYMTGQILQNSWMAANVDNPRVNTLQLIAVYVLIGLFSTLAMLFRSFCIVYLGIGSSKSLFSLLLNSLFRSPMSFYDSTPLGRILSRVSSDLSIMDLNVPFSLIFAVGTSMLVVANLGVLVVFTWQVLFVSLPTVYLALQLQRYYFHTANELMRINGTTKSMVANYLAESVAGATTIRAFQKEERFFAKNLELIDINTSPFFHSFAAYEWLVLRLETLNAMVLAVAAVYIVILPPGTFSSGFVGMALSYGLSINMSLVYCIQYQCDIANYIVSVERLNQYMYIQSEAPEVIEENRPPTNWPDVGKVEIRDLQMRYRANAPLVLRGISCTFEGGHKIGIVGRTGSGKTTLIGALFRLVEPTGGKIIIDGIDISTIGLHDLRSRFGVIPQEPTLFNGTIRFNLDPLSQHSDHEIWEVLEKCQLREVVQEKEEGLDSLVVDDGSNWSMGQRQLFCLGRALLRRSRILVLDEATASIDNTTDMIMQKTIRTEFKDCTVITVAHRIPTVMDCTMVLAMSDGHIVEYDEPIKLMKKEDSLFGKLVNEYWSHQLSAQSH